MGEGIQEQEYNQHNNIKNQVHLLDISWDDVLITQVLARLSLQDILTLRQVSKACLLLVELFFRRLRTLRITAKSSYSSRVFAIYTSLCERLQYINFARSSFLTNDILVPLLKKNPGLIRLDLSYCPNITAICLQPVILHCDNLKVLKLAKCSWLTTGAVEALTLHQQRIEEVDFSYCTNVSSSCIILFFKKFCHLKTIVLQGLDTVDDKCLITVSKYNRLLKHLNVAQCGNITDLGIRAVGMNCPQLECLAVRKCTLVTEKSLAPLRPRVMMDVRRSI